MLTLHHHPFASFCQKVLVALYELGLPFESAFVLDDVDRRALTRLSPMGKMPALRDGAAGRVVFESTTVIEYLDRRAPGGAQLVPADPDDALEVRLWDRFLDGFVELPMQKVVADALRPADARDPFGVDEARATLTAAYGTLDGRMAGRAWIAGPAFSMADCGAASALFYGRVVQPWDEPACPHLTRYYATLMHRPSVIRVVDEARPYRDLFPLPWPPAVDDHQPERVR